MSAQFETLGNASVIVFDDANPVLATDPWLTGTCYFGSWALDHPLSQQQIRNFVEAEWIWISHGHPDHLHDASLTMLPAGKKFLLPDHYDNDIALNLQGRGFDVTILPYRTWYPLTSRIRVMCIDNINQDAVLVVEADGALIIDLNDSPLCGEFNFLRRSDPALSTREDLPVGALLGRCGHVQFRRRIWAVTRRTAGRTQARRGSLDGCADGGATGCWELLLLLVTAHLRARQLRYGPTPIASVGPI